VSLLSEHAAPLAVGAVWLLVTSICYPRGIAALIGCAPVAVVISWAFWLQAQGWPVGDGKFAGLGFFTLAVLVGLAGGASSHCIPRALGGSMRSFAAADPIPRRREANYLAASVKGEGLLPRERAPRDIVVQPRVSRFTASANLSSKSNTSRNPIIVVKSSNVSSAAETGRPWARSSQTLPIALAAAKSAAVG
jgi:hypothetical protein